MTAWVNRAWEHGVLAKSCYRDGYIAIYWDLGGASIESLNKDQLSEIYIQFYPDASKRTISVDVGQIYRFANNIQIGDMVIMPDPSARTYHIGETTSPCYFDNTDHFHHEGSYRRNVTWQIDVPYDASLSESVRRSLNSGHSTVYSAKEEVLNELINASQGDNKLTDRENHLDIDQVINNIDVASYKKISEQIMNLRPNDMEHLVAGLLRAIGYITEITPFTGDGGYDIKATLDPSINGVGFDEPNLIVEVKQRKSKMGASKIREFNGVLHGNDRGLYVSTGGFTKGAQEALNQAEHPIKLFDMNDFIRLYIKYYENTDEETRAILPLKRIYWPE